VPKILICMSFQFTVYASRRAPRALLRRSFHSSLVPRLNRTMHRLIACLTCLAFSAPALAVTGNAPPAVGWAARGIVMIVDAKGDLCTGTALARELVLTAAHCVTRPERYEVRTFQGGQAIPIAGIARHPSFELASYAAGLATADIALIKLAAPLPSVIVPVSLAATRRVRSGETLTIAGFGTTEAGGDRGLGVPRMATLTVTGVPGSLQIRLYDDATRNRRPGLGACTGDSGAPAYDGEGPLVIGVVSWSTAANDEEGCGGLTGLTPLLLHRKWIEDTAKKFNSPLTH
jgi:secreted trypsin-like serine protease